LNLLFCDIIFIIRFNIGVICVLSDTREHNADLPLPRQRQRVREDVRRKKNVQSDCVKAQLSNGRSGCSSLAVEGKVNISLHSSHRVVIFDRSEGKDSRNNSSSHIAADQNSYQKDSYGSKHKRHSSTDVTDGRYRDNVNGRQPSSHGHKSAPRKRSCSAGSRSEPHWSNSKDVDRSAFQKSLNNSALKQKMEKKLRWINSSSHSRHIREDTRGLAKTPVHRETLIAGSTKHKMKTPQSTVKHDGALDT